MCECVNKPFCFCMLLYSLHLFLFLILSLIVLCGPQCWCVYTLLLILLPCLLLYMCKTQCCGSLNPLVESFHLYLCLSWLTCTTTWFIHYIDLIHSHKELAYYKQHTKNNTCWFHICTILFSCIYLFLF